MQLNRWIEKFAHSIVLNLVNFTLRPCLRSNYSSYNCLDDKCMIIILFFMNLGLIELANQTMLPWESWSCKTRKIRSPLAVHSGNNQIRKQISLYYLKAVINQAASWHWLSDSSRRIIELYNSIRWINGNLSSTFQPFNWAASLDADLASFRTRNAIRRTYIETTLRRWQSHNSSQNVLHLITSNHVCLLWLHITVSEGCGARLSSSWSSQVTWIKECLPNQNKNRMDCEVLLDCRRVAPAQWMCMRMK